MSLRTRKHMLPWHRKTLYAAGSLSFGVTQNTVSGLIMFFGIAAHNVMGSLMGVICAFGVLASAIMDPIAGHISDRTLFKLFGRRYAYIIFGMFLIAAINIYVWSVPSWFPIWAKFLWFFSGVILMEIMNSFVQVPYNSLGNELAGGNQERELIHTYRYVSIMLGLIVPVALMGIFLKDITNIAEFRAMACVGSIVIILCGLLTFFGTYSHLPRLRAKATQQAASGGKIPDIFREFFQALKIKDFRALLLGYAIGFMSIAFLTTIGLFYFKYTVGISFQLIASLISIVFGFVMISCPLWNRLPRKDKRSGLLIAMMSMFIGTLCIAVVFILNFYTDLSADKFWMYIPGMIFIGIGAGGMFMLPRSIMDELVTVYNKEGRSKVGTGLLNFSYKLAASITALIVGILLDVFSFSSSSAVAGTMPEYTYAALGWILVAGLFITTLTSFILYAQFGKSRDGSA